MVTVIVILIGVICFAADELERRRVDRRVEEIKRAWLDGDE